LDFWFWNPRSEDEEIQLNALDEEFVKEVRSVATTRNRWCDETNVEHLQDVDVLHHQYLRRTIFLKIEGKNDEYESSKNEK
jgi:hypothetical protein